LPLPLDLALPLPLACLSLCRCLCLAFALPLGRPAAGPVYRLLFFIHWRASGRGARVSSDPPPPFACGFRSDLNTFVPMPKETRKFPRTLPLGGSDALCCPLHHPFPGNFSFAAVTIRSHINPFTIFWPRIWEFWTRSSGSLQKTRV